MTKPILSKNDFRCKSRNIVYKRMKEMLSYDFETGIFTWLVDGKRRAKYKAGDIAGTRYQDGYTTIAFMGMSFQAARLAWLYVHEEFPKGEIDHIDRDKNNNSIFNLRDVSRWVNMQNRCLSDDTRSGVTGVNMDRHDRWSASISVNGVYHYLGCHKSLLAAAKARYRAEKRYKCLGNNFESQAQLYVESQTGGGKNG
jgi:hypothetical protein